LSLSSDDLQIDIEIDKTQAKTFDLIFCANSHRGLLNGQAPFDANAVSAQKAPINFRFGPKIEQRNRGNARNRPWRMVGG